MAITSHSVELCLGQLRDLLHHGDLSIHASLPVDADEASAARCAHLLTSWGYQVTVVHSPESALDRCKTHPYPLVITEGVFPNSKRGEGLIQQIHALDPQAKVLVLTDHPTSEGVTQAMRLGVCEYLAKPVADVTLQEAVRRSLAGYGICQISDQEINRAVGAQVRWHRQERAMTTEGMAHRVGLSQSLISQVETGRSTPSVVTLYKVARALDLSLSELLDGV